MSSRCDTCEFWQHDPLDVERQQGWHADDRTGTCRRKAPRPTTGEHEYYVRMALWLVAPEYDELDKNWEEAGEATSSWPSTQARDWCGEWKQKPLRILEEELRKLGFEIDKNTASMLEATLYRVLVSKLVDEIERLRDGILR